MRKTITTSLNIEVPFFDVDSYKIVWHGNYPKYFEQARCQLLEVINFPYSKMESSGFYFPIIDMQIRYIKPIIFKQKIHVTASLKEWENKLVIDYLISDASNKDKLTKAQTTQAAILMPDQVTQYKSPLELTSKVEKYLQEL